METFDASKFSLVESLLLAIICTDEETKAKFSANKIDALKCEVELKINGVDMPFSSAVKRMARCLDREVEKQHKELFREEIRAIKDKARTATEYIDEMTSEMVEKIKRDFPDAWVDER